MLTLVLIGFYTVGVFVSVEVQKRDMYPLDYVGRKNYEGVTKRALLWPFILGRQLTQKLINYLKSLI